MDMLVLTCTVVQALVCAWCTTEVRRDAFMLHASPNAHVVLPLTAKITVIASFSMFLHEIDQNMSVGLISLYEKNIKHKTSLQSTGSLQ